MGAMKFTTDLALRRIERIQHLLRRQDSTVQEISDEIHLSKRWAYDYVKYLHENKLIHIADWRKEVRSNGAWSHIPIYCWGKAKDAKKPEALTSAEISRRYRNHPDRGLENQERDRKKKMAKRLVPTRDWTAAWIPTKEAA